MSITGSRARRSISPSLRLLFLTALRPTSVNPTLDRSKSMTQIGRGATGVVERAVAVGR
jgi:hypothetical protein